MSRVAGVATGFRVDMFCLSFLASFIFVVVVRSIILSIVFGDMIVDVGCWPSDVTDGYIPDDDL